jgi:integrase/recombinase XerC
MAGRQPVAADCRVRDLVARFMAYHEGSSAATRRFYARPLASFVEYVGNLKVSDLKAYHVAEWLDREHKTIKRARKEGDAYLTEDTDRRTSDNYRRNLSRAVKACFRWAEEREYIDRSPIRKLKVPPATPRGDEAYLTAGQWAKLIAAVKDQPLLDLLTILKETGCRPQEARRVETRHLDREGRCWVFPKEESKGRKQMRVVHLGDNAFEICLRLALKNPTGPIFRNRNSNPWESHVLNYRCYRLGKRLGFRITPYCIRHTFATDAIIRGVDLQTIADLMGHTDLRMLSGVYQHLRRRGDHMKEGLRRAIGA